MSLQRLIDRTGLRFKAWPVVFMAIPALVIVIAVSIFKSSSGNLLSAQDISASYGVIREEKMFDRKVPDVNYPIDDFVSSVFLAEDSFVVFDLGREKAIRYLQLNSYQDNFIIWVSRGGDTFTPVPLKKSEGDGSVVNCYAGDKGLLARYIKLTLEPGTKTGAVFEFTALDKLPAVYPLAFQFQNPPTYQAALDADLKRLGHIRLIKMAICLGIVVLLYASKEKYLNMPRYIYALIFFFGIISFVMFKNPVGNLHPWEIAHYYLGAKYNNGIGYKDIYRELALNEIRNGRGIMVQRAYFRDLANYQLLPGSSVYQKILSTPSAFSASDLVQLNRDVDRIRTLDGYAHYQSIFKDHGYNGSPLYTAVFGSLFRIFPAGHSFFTLMALLDLLMLFGGVAVIWMTFGPAAGAVCSVLIGLGEPWSYIWTGGSIGRYLWFILFCSGFALIKRNNRFWGVPLLCLAGLLRLYPFVFVMGIGFVLFSSFLKDRRGIENIKWLYMTLLVLAVGLVIPIFVNGFDIYPQFMEKMRLHSQNQSLNRIALSSLFNKELVDLRHDNVLFLAKMFFASAYLFAILRLGKDNIGFWHALPLSGILIFAFIPLSSYDYIWMVCLVPACMGSRIRMGALFLALGGSNLFSETFFAQGYLYTDFIFSAFILIYYASYIYDLVKYPKALNYA